MKCLSTNIFLNPCNYNHLYRVVILWEISFTYEHTNLVYLVFDFISDLSSMWSVVIVIQRSKKGLVNTKVTLAVC